jgi:RNA polymerase sigma-70 factor (ECF subfamily)
MPLDTEAELIVRCRQGETKAWDALFDQHYSAAARFVGQLAADISREDIEEICQEVFLTVVKSLGTFRGSSRFQTWLFRIAANKARDYRERQWAAKRGGGQTLLSLQAEDPQSGLVLDPPSREPGPDMALVNAERQLLLHQALDRLDVACQEMIQLRYFGDLSYDEIAAELKLNPKTVSSRLSRCLDRLEQIVRAVFSREKSSPFPV